MQHDACGVGFVADTRRRSSRDLVTIGLTALRRVTHRGAPASLGAVDGCGVLTGIPWAVLSAAGGGSLPEKRTRALGMLFVSPADRHAAVEIVERELGVARASSVTWREVPIDPAAVLPAQRSGTPIVLQVVAGFDVGRAQTEAAIYRARLRAERAARLASIALSISSLSTRTVVYKGLVTPDALDRFYPDLADTAFASDFIVFHQRFSTNTSADWSLAQPFRTVAHNGEINTIAGNRSWMRARSLDPTSLRGFDTDIPVSLDGSDSRALDDALELLRHHGYSLPHALARLVPPAWERDDDLSPAVRAFHEFQSLLSEPCDGPSALVFADGRIVGAALDRNGFRPARYVRTAAGLVALASEVGVLAASEHDIVDRGRLGPGECLVVDLRRGTLLNTAAIREKLASRRPYRSLLARCIADLGSRIADAHADPFAVHHREADPFAVHDRESESAIDFPRSEIQSAVRNPQSAIRLARSQALFGCTREEIDVLLKPMITEGHEAVGSMGDDAPPAVLSSRSRLFTDFFRQRFAQVTNPSVDPYREAAVMSLTTVLGAHGSFVDESAPRPRRVALRSPILEAAQFGALHASATSVDITWGVEHGVDGFEQRLLAVVDEACHAVKRGSAMIVLTDRGGGASRAPLPAGLATAAVHHALIARGLRMRASIVVDTGDARDAHQVAILCAFGAAAVHPWLGYATVGGIDVSADAAATAARYRSALERGLLTIMSKMGVCTFAGYCGSALFEVLGLDASVVDRFLPGTPSPIGGATLADVAATIVERHRRAFATDTPGAEYPGLHGYRRDGEYHATNPLVVRSLHRARTDATTPAYDTFTSHVYGRPPAAVRDLLEFAGTAAIPEEQVESVDAICKRFFVSAMSVGALSPETHRMIAAAMNRIGARSNGGEGGEEPDRFNRVDGSRTKQVASARFGVTPAYLRSADELQIKIAQGSKPGEGGQLPGMKVVSHIARLRHAQPGTTLISPPVHHDIYSIEDLAELIHDLRVFHPTARMNVKLVSSTGVGIIAAGVVKAGADAIQISGHDGGTGASPRSSIKHAGMPWEIGVREAHRALAAAGLRHRVVLQTDGGLKTGRDIAMAAALGADEFGFGTAALVALGCVMARQCHANTCPVGIATQRPDLRRAFAGTADMLIGYLHLVAQEVRTLLASLGLRRVEDLIGRTDLVRRRDGVKAAINVDGLLTPVDQHLRRERRNRDAPAALSILSDSIGSRNPLVINGPIANTDRAFGADIAGAIAARRGDAGLPDGSVRMQMTGSAGQSFGAFALPGMRLVLIGDANDGLGKGMHGGEIVVAPTARERGRRGQVLVGNAALYGATGGRAFIAGLAGERFAIRNSGATAVVEGVGDHACEYMTGGTVVVIGRVGRNFAAGMTGGVAYLWSEAGSAPPAVDGQSLTLGTPSIDDHVQLRALLLTHERLTGSRIARTILRRDRALSGFWRIAPVSIASEPAQPDDLQAVNE